MNTKESVLKQSYYKINNSNTTEYVRFYNEDPHNKNCILGEYCYFGICSVTKRVNKTYYFSDIDEGIKNSCIVPISKSEFENVCEAVKKFLNKYKN